MLEPFTVSGVSDSILAKLLCLCVYAGIRVDTLCLPTKNRRLFWTTGIVAMPFFSDFHHYHRLKMFEVWIWLALVAAVPMLSWQANKLSLADGQVYWNTISDQLGTIAVHQNGEQKVATRWIIMTIVDGDSWWLIRWSPHQRYENISLVVIQEQKDKITQSFRCLK